MVDLLQTLKVANAEVVIIIMLMKVILFEFLTKFRKNTSNI